MGSAWLVRAASSVTGRCASDPMAGWRCTGTR